MKKNITFILLITLIFQNEVYAQLKEPQNPCPEKKGNVAIGNTESDPCDVNVPEAYSQCLCNYYKELKEYNKKLGEYQSKNRDLQGRIQSYMGGGNRKDALIGISKSQGFEERKQKILADLKKDLERLHSGLKLSFEQNKYCIGTANCADGNIKYFQGKIEEVNKEIGDVIRMESTETDQIVLQSTNNSSNNNNTTSNNTTTTNKTAQDFRSEANNMVVQYQYQQDYKNYLLKRANEIENRPKRGMTVTGGMDGSGSNNAYLNSINQQKYTYSQKYQNQMATIDAVSSAVSTIGNYFYQRAAEKQRYEEQQQRIREQKEERDRLFDNEVNRVRSQYRSFVNERSRLFAKPANKTNTFELDGSSFEPIFLYFAYTDKDYTDVKETINKPYSMDFKVNEECKVTFSNLIAVFPMSNGQYPYLDDIHKQIKAKYPHLFSGNYKINIFPYLRGIDNAINALTQDMENSINKYNFAGVKILEGEQILFLNDQIDASQSIDYWTGEKVKQTKTEKVDYFDTEKQPTKTNKKIDYWETDKKKEPAKTTEPKKETKPKKEINYWDN